MSQLWSLVLLLSVFVLGGAGGQSAPVKGKGGQSALELSCSAGNVSGGCGGDDASQLWSLVVVLLSVFVLGGAGGQSASGL